MTHDNSDFKVLPFAAERRLVADAGRMGSQRFLVHGLVEFDVTEAREFIRQHKAKTGESLSFTAFLVGCLAKAISSHPMLQAHLNWRNQLIQFSDVDVVTLVEAGTSHFPHIIRGANRKTFRQIHDEIRSVKTKPEKSSQKSGRLVRWAPYIPGFIRGLFYRALLMNPHWLKQYAGTVVVTAVGMFAKGGGWGWGFAPFHTLTLTIGGIGEKPALINGQLVNREYVCITLSIDHMIVDGAPAARFAQCLKELVESGYGLVE